MLKGLEVNLVVPDLWQQEAVRALRAGQDVVVQAPTGAGKTSFSSCSTRALKGQAIYTVPTRALANDKLAEWRARGWDVGIATGDLALNLDAQGGRRDAGNAARAGFLRREGPRLLVVDEYQMIADPVRGVHYELALALAPPQTQLLLLSGSVANPQDIVEWLQRIGRDAVSIRIRNGPCRSRKSICATCPTRNSCRAKAFWPRMIGRALARGARRRCWSSPRAETRAEEMAQAIASAMTIRDPLPLSAAQEALAGQTTGETVAQPRRVSSQRTELCGARGIDRAARESRPAERRRRDDGARRRASISPCAPFSSPGRVIWREISSVTCSRMNCCKCSAAPDAADSMKSDTS